MIRITSMTEDLVVDEKKLQEKWTPQYMWVPPIVLNLPCNTQLIEEYCAENNIMSADVVNLRLQHQEGGSSALVKSESKPYEPEGMEMGALYRSAQFLMDVQDLGCPIIPEREIIVHEILSGFTTKVVFEGKICIEKKLPLAPFHLEPFLYEMKALYQLRECPGIVEFIGVDVDNKRNTLQGYLRACEEYDLSTVLRKGTSRENHIPWSVRERWAGQIIDGIYNAHLKGIVIGTLDVNEIGVDDDHNAKLLHVGHGKCLLKSGCLAPELRPRVDHSDARMRLTDAHMNARQDVFALGLVLWILAQTRLKEKVILDTRTVGRKAWWKRQFCIISKCPFGNEDLENNHCQQIHADPIDLPLCSRDIPVYYRELIARCRATSPQLRATAREVKQLFGIGIRRSAVKSTEKSIAKRRKDSVISDTST
jgi:serine/threonine protein kinase